MTDEQIIEVLATKGMGWNAKWSIENPKVLVITKQDGYLLNWKADCSGGIWWDPLTDLNTVADIEAGLTDEQRRNYVRRLQEAFRIDWLKHTCFEFALSCRHASPRVCCEALVKALTYSESGAQSEPK